MINRTKKRIMNKRTGLLTITKRKSLQSVHPPYLTINILILLCCTSCDSKIMLNACMKQWKRKFRGSKCELCQQTTRGQKIQIRKKTAFYMKTIMSNWDSTGLGNRRDNTQSLPEHDTPIQEIRNSRNISDRVRGPKQKHI
jgi:hypothetical protein